jgi:hypothetical protein
MNRLIPALAVSLALTACTAGPGMRGRALPPKANPSAVIAAELAFARLAQEKGQWSAFRQTAAAEAVMFVPQRVRAQDWLKGRTDPATAVKWQPSAVWSSCDGSYAVTQGQWRSANSSGGFVTVWQRQGDPRRPTGYKWVLDMSVTTEQVTAAADTIAAKVADCGGAAPPLVLRVTTSDLDSFDGQSTDSTLIWNAVVARNGSRRITVQFLEAGTYKTALELDGRDID